MRKEIYVMGSTNEKTFYEAIAAREIIDEQKRVAIRIEREKIIETCKAMGVDDWTLNYKLRTFDEAAIGNEVVEDILTNKAYAKKLGLKVVRNIFTKKTYITLKNDYSLVKKTMSFEEYDFATTPSRFDVVR